MFGREARCSNGNDYPFIPKHLVDLNIELFYELNPKRRSI